MLHKPLHTDAFNTGDEITECGPHEFCTFYMEYSCMQYSRRIQNWLGKLRTQTTRLKSITDHI